MTKAFFRKIVPASILCMAAISFLFYLPATSFGEGECPLPLSFDVSPYQVNIDAGGAAHYVRVLTYTSYRNTLEAFVYIYINGNFDEIDPDYIVLTRDSLGRLVVKIDLDAFQDAGLEAEMSHILRIAVILKKVDVDGCSEKEGEGEIYIIGKKGG